MLSSKSEVIKFFELEVERLKRLAEAAERQSRESHAAAGNTRVAYQAAPSDSSARAMLRASIFESRAFQQLFILSEDVNTATAALRFIVSTLQRNELDKSCTD